MAISVSNWVWDHSRSRNGARLVLLAIADCARENGVAWPSVAELRRKTGLGDRAVQAAIIDLAKLCELEVGYQQGPKGCNRYRLLMPAYPADIAGAQKLRGAKTAGAQNSRGPESSQVSGKDPADSAPPAESAPPQSATPAPAVSAGGTVKEPPLKKNSPSESSDDGALFAVADSPKPKRKARAKTPASRIPDDFVITEDMRAWARQEIPGFDIDYHTRIFIDYWRQRADSLAEKADWVATWRNWMRKQVKDEAAGVAAPQVGGSRQHQSEQARLQRQLARAAAREAEM